MTTVIRVLGKTLEDCRQEVRCMNISSDQKVGQLAGDFPLATRVLARHGIDYCCGGGIPLEEACSRAGVEVGAVVDEIREVLDGSPGPVRSWQEAPLRDVIGHILVAFHRPLEEELPRLETMAEKVFRVHGDKDPEMLGAVLETLRALKAELEEHMQKEEQVLFPMILQGQGAQAGAPIEMMEHEHESAGAALKRLRQVTHGYLVPEEACNTWRALWHGLADLEKALHEHIHLENNILFPRALGG